MDLPVMELFSLETSNSSDSLQTDFKGIVAQDLSSLLLQFEEASQSSEDSGNASILSTDSILNGNKSSEETQQQEPQKDIQSKLEEVKAKCGVKRKGAILLPMGVPSKGARGRALALSPQCSSPKLQKILSKTTAIMPDSSTETVSPIVTTPATTDSLSDGAVSSTYYSEISDHDYCQNYPHSPSTSLTSQSRGEDCLQLHDVSSNQFDQPISETKPVKRKLTPKEYKHKYRNYRKKSKTDKINTDSEFFDKIPSYFTTLSIPAKPPKKDPKSEEGSGIKVADIIERDISPSLVNSSDVYNKLPAYHNCFINSTKYDESSSQHSAEDIEILRLKNTKYPWDRLRDKLSRENSSSRSSSPLMMSSRCESKSREMSCSPQRSRSVSRSPLPHRYRHSRSSDSSCSSRSSSYSRSRSRDSVRRRRKCRSRDSSRRRHQRRERGHSYSSYSSRSSDSEWESRSRSRSRSYSRTRGSRTRSRSPRRRRYRHSSSYDRLRAERERLREEEKKRQIEERRIVYVGRIPENYTRRQLRSRFGKFGEIEETSVHFRETGDNYGFVTFVYTCDAYAAIEHGNKVAGEEKFTLCFGGRREFCTRDYEDLDHQVAEEEENCLLSQKSAVLDFDQLLKDAKRKLSK